MYTHQYDNPITQRRKQLGLSRQDLALASNLGNSTIQNLENGHPARLGPITSVSLSRALGCDVEILQRQYVAWRSSVVRKDTL